MRTQTLAVALMLCGVATAAIAQEPPDALETVKAALARDWVVEYAGSPDTVAFRSPIYVMPFGGACVTHRLTFLPDLTGQPNMASMVATSAYYAWASGEACKAVDPREFYEFEAGSDVIGLLDIARRAKDGPKAGVDTVARADRARIAACFTPEAMRTTRVWLGNSVFDSAAKAMRYRLVLQCGALMGGENIHVTREGQGDALTWEIQSMNVMSIPAR